VIDRASDVVALLDANVLYPMPLCDTMLSLAEGYPFAALYLPRWSADILEETRRNLVVDGRCTPAQALRRIQLMNDAFPEASVTAYEALIPSLGNDEGDRHVLAAAIRAGAQHIVTRNVRHFPHAAVEPFGMRAVTPDAFLLNLCTNEIGQASLADTIVRQSQSLRRPQLTVRQVLRALSHEIPETSSMVENYLMATQPRALDTSSTFGTAGAAVKPKSAQDE